MLTSPAGRAFIKTFEGLELVSKDDGFGNPTVGWGHLGVPLGTRISTAQAEAYLTEDLAIAERAVNDDIHVPLTQGQFDVLVSFTMNEGTGALHDSTLRRMLNTGDYASVRIQLLRWNYANGRVVLGLTRRRQQEADLWLAASPALNPIDPSGSRTINGGAVAVAGGSADVAMQVNDVVQQAQWHLSAGNWIGVAIGAMIVAGGLWAIYARLDDAGKLPWHKKAA